MRDGGNRDLVVLPRAAACVGTKILPPRYNEVLENAVTKVRSAYAILVAMTPGVFIPDRDPAFCLLAGHRQPLAENVARAYIEQLSSPSDLVVDPCAASPSVVRAALACGRRIIAVDSNPLVAFATRLQ